MVKLKQYLENSWYRWASQDRQTWYAAQFQYGENINIRDMKNGVCLSWGSTDVGSTYNYEFSYFTYEWKLYSVDRVWIVRDENWNTKCNLWINSTQVPQAVQFWNDIYVTSSVGVHKIDSSWSYTNITDPDRPVYPFPTCMLNYANTFLLVWAANQVWRYDITLWWTWKMIRDFESGYLVQWLTQEWNYLKIYTSNWLDTKIHYAKGTFDVEYTWLIQTVSFAWLAVDLGGVASDQWQDYAIFTAATWELKLSKIQWYNKTDIRWTETWDWEKIFTSSSTPYITASDWVVFAATDEWIWTFTEYNWWLRGWCIEFKESNAITNVFKYKERLYVCISNWNGKYRMRYYDMSFHPDKYQSSGFIIGRVFDWGCAWLFKKNDQATITYNMPAWTSMELSYRYDRTSFAYDKDNFLPIKKLTDTNECYDIVVPTTPSKTDVSLLAKESSINDLILLENWNGIQLEEMLVIPFNKTWNLLEYRFDLNTTDTTKTPILFEHSLTYYDYMRKYR